ncbi:oxidoreductase [Oceanicola sp. 22II-s10i]|uniref:2OG-Fe(II) oxygenase n=1 Tax=Oceanicola sp. 22II-s10i TaxID=1317116 RepID=UPI000B52814B|nr:2OG-Fe(II) oxygenase [Oceanicola sp. 22II-s10i]OWU85193.1 oxidoreductase [Oceanicola sp. 22II-s10i]
MLTLHSVPDAFSAAECDRLCALAEAAPSAEARLVGAQRDHNIRRADLVWLDDLPDTGWVMDRLIDVVRVANRDVFDFALTDFSESPQIASYGAEKAGHFDWHADIGDGRLAARRKLTLVVQLSEPGDYEGGVLEVMPTSAVLTARRERGTAALFPAFALHRVTPVTQGRRRSLTVWAHGPAFR